MTMEVVSERIAEIYAALGANPAEGRRPVLLPIQARKKGPQFKGWQEITWSDTQRPDYQKRLAAAGNIGVLVGPASGHLASIDIDDDALVEEFLDLNPELRHSLISKGARGINVWVWLEPSLRDFEEPGYPVYYDLEFTDRTHKGMAKIPDPDAPGQMRSVEQDLPLPFGEWRAGGGHQTVIAGVHPTGVDYRWLAKGPPPIVRFADIAWPKGLKRPWEDAWWQQVEARYGPPWYDTGRGQVLNEAFWVGWYARRYELLWEPDEGRFFQYDPESGLWADISRDRLKGFFQHEMRKQALLMGNQWLERQRSNQKLNALTEFCRSEVEAREAFRVRRDYEQGPGRRLGVIHVGNGMVDLREDPPRMQPFHSDFFSRNKIDFDFSEEAECPRFLNELLRPQLPDPSDVSLLQRYMGQTLLGVNLTQTLLILSGNAGTGKSTTINLLSKLIGEKNVGHLRTRWLEERFEIYGFIGKMLLIGPDVKGDFLNQPSAYVIKSLVGGDSLSAERKNGETFTIRGEFNVMISCNSRLRVRLDSDAGAWRRRLLILPFTASRPKRPIPHFDDVLIREEGAGILRWVIMGAVQLLADIEAGRGMVQSDAEVDRVESLLAESDSVRYFLRKAIEPADRTQGRSLRVEEIVETYTDFCEEMGWTAEPARRVQQQLPDLMLQMFRANQRKDIRRGDKQYRGWMHVQFRAGAAGPKEELL